MDPSLEEPAAKRPNNDRIREIKSLKHLEKLRWDIDSPRFKKAAHNIGIGLADLVRKNKAEFEPKAADDDVVQLRYKHHL